VRRDGARLLGAHARHLLLLVGRRRGEAAVGQHRLLHLALRVDQLEDRAAAADLDVVGVRRDEEPTRAKERYFSPRSQTMEWDATDQPPEFWNQFKTDFAPGTHIRIHPLLHWTELNVWEYIEREAIPVSPLYFDDGTGHRYRSLGCAPCTTPVLSTARTVSEIVSELRTTRTAERAGRAQDQESENAFEKLRRDGYM
jgi:sulfate adenylyltransferase subunit 2